jgi:hypothetical protein
MLDSGGKSRVKSTLQPLADSAHSAIIPARILAPWLWGDENGDLKKIFSTTSPYHNEGGVEGSRGNKFFYWGCLS